MFNTYAERRYSKLLKARDEALISWHQYFIDHKAEFDKQRDEIILRIFGQFKETEHYTSR